MKKTLIAKLAALALALTIIVQVIPPPCCEAHKGTGKRCPPPPPPITRTILDGKTNG